MIYPNYFFFINNIFYSNALHTDPATCVHDFLQKYNQSQTYEKQFADIRFEDLNLQVGRPYVYQHLGQCEHVMVISDIRLANGHDPNGKLLTAVGISNCKPCMLCASRNAKWLVTNFPKLTVSRSFLCHRCFLSYCYVNGRKAGGFQAYQYFEPSIVCSITPNKLD